MPIRDVLIPVPRPNRPPGGDAGPPMALKKLGEPCGSCMCPPTFTAGECEKGLECVHNPMIADAPGKCIRPGM